ncbi:hypothetical protein ANO11243_080340 [Dothideomycetidae sp. 11243]|nr:hypothetical protein ANO11243_080340 [fungal sp. No.11243]
MAEAEAKKPTPQKRIDNLWDAFTTKQPGLVLNVLPDNVFAKTKARHEPKGTAYAHGATKSFDEASAECIAAVNQIVRECKRVNMRYRDPHFDIEFDLKLNIRDCLDSIDAPFSVEKHTRHTGNDSDSEASVPLERKRRGPRSAKRVTEIFKNPRFFVDGASAADVRQGKAGDCYFLAAVGALGEKSGLIDKICVHRDEQVGVYGFVFHRDGEWIHTIVDDKLYLTMSDYREGSRAKNAWTAVANRATSEQEYRATFQTGSRALYFAQCSDENETWLPLLEKAYAKAHGDFQSIEGGFTGEAIEDLTGGVTTELFATDILDKDKFWTEEMRHVGDKFLFGCTIGLLDRWNAPSRAPDEYHQGIHPMHAYTILRATEYEGERLVQVRNPWGYYEWTGRWSDGSEQWTPKAMEALNHRFGDDGVFWISFDDLLNEYQFLDRTRLFDESWHICQQWTSFDVRWTADYNDTKFSLTLSESGPVVLILSQLDNRYWKGLEGQYRFTLHFRVDKDGEDGYVVRSHGNYWMDRSVSTEVTLEAGTYSVLVKVEAVRWRGYLSVEDVIRRNCENNQAKLVQVGLSYDLAHVKGKISETEDSKRQRATAEAKVKAKEKQKAIEKAKKKKYKDWLSNTRKIERERREKVRLDKHKQKKKDSESADDDTNGAEKKQDDEKKEDGKDSEASKDVELAVDVSRKADDKDSRDGKDGIDGKDGKESGKSQDKVATDDDTKSIITYASSVDSVLDLDLSDEDESDEEGKDEKPAPENEGFSNDPWNAVCVVGLRVYSQSGEVSIGVVRPKTGDDEDDTPLDVDDPSKGVSDETVEVGKDEDKKAM